MPDWMTGPDVFLIGALGFMTLVLAMGPILDRRHEKRKHRPGAKVAMYRESMVMLWAMAIVVTLGWILSGRSLAEIGFVSLREGWQGLAALGLLVLALAYCAWQLIQVLTSKRARASVRQQIGEVKVDLIRPTTKTEAWHFQAISFTAGVTEEVIFRGVLIAALALVMPLWLAVIISVVAFTLPHAYQGLAGMAKVLPTGAFLTAIVLLGGALWPAILAHWVIDMTAGLTFAVLDRHEDEDATADGAADTEVRDTAALEV